MSFKELFTLTFVLKTFFIFTEVDQQDIFFQQKQIICSIFYIHYMISSRILQMCQDFYSNLLEFLHFINLFPNLNNTQWILFAYNNIKLILLKLKIIFNKDLSRIQPNK